MKLLSSKSIASCLLHIGNVRIFVSRMFVFQTTQRFMFFTGPIATADWPIDSFMTAILDMNNSFITHCLTIWQ